MTTTQPVTTAQRGQNALSDLPRHPRHPKWLWIQSYEDLQRVLGNPVRVGGLPITKQFEHLARLYPRARFIYDNGCWNLVFIQHGGYTMRPSAQKNSYRVPARGRLVVSTYEITRCYGGPEEGGWWYDWYEHVSSSRPMRPCRAEALRRKLSKDLPKKEDGSLRRRRYSSIGGADTEVFMESWGGENASRVAPHYE